MTTRAMIMAKLLDCGEALHGAGVMLSEKETREHIRRAWPEASERLLDEALVELGFEIDGV